MFRGQPVATYGGKLVSEVRLPNRVVHAFRLPVVRFAVVASQRRASSAIATPAKVYPISIDFLLGGSTLFVIGQLTERMRSADNLFEAARTDTLQSSANTPRLAYRD